MSSGKDFVLYVPIVQLLTTWRADVIVLSSIGLDCWKDTDGSSSVYEKSETVYPLNDKRIGSLRGATSSIPLLATGPHISSLGVRREAATGPIMAPLLVQTYIYPSESLSAW